MLSARHIYRRCTQDVYIKYKDSLSSVLTFGAVGRGGNCDRIVHKIRIMNIILAPTPPHPTKNWSLKFVRVCAGGGIILLTWGKHRRQISPNRNSVHGNQASLHLRENAGIIEHDKSRLHILF